jgi:GT2 family glycosyltransferase/glycosyltransferase involved in cell wall biosynthesis
MKPVTLPNTESSLSCANAALRHRDFETAIALYEDMLRTAETPLRLFIRFNLEFARRRLRLQSNHNDDTSLAAFRMRLKVVNEIEVLQPHFDHDYYLSQNADVAESGADPVDHYCTVGWLQKRDPHPEFSTAAYLHVNADVSGAGVNPFFHWVTDGRLEGRAGLPTIKSDSISPTTNPGLFVTGEPAGQLSEPVDIIVPIFNAYEDVRECLDRLHRFTPQLHRVTLINDASTDPRIQPLCDEFIARRPTAVHISQPTNLGFIGTVNSGFSKTKGHVVLLNTDAFVPENWLERLMAPLLADKQVATVTPMTSNGEIANVPVMCKALELPRGVADQLDLVARRFDPQKTVAEIPTGVGFCMAMSHHWLKRVPGFDTTFGRGYGEEVDWCQQVSQLGGKHLLTGALFVEHRGGMSFGAEKQARIAANNHLISQRYPYFDRSVQGFVEGDTAIAPRLALGLALIGTEGEVPVFLAHRLGGGAEIWLKEIIDTRLEKKQSAVVLRDGDTKGTALVELHMVNGIARGNIYIDELADYMRILPKKEIVYSCLVATSDPLTLIDILATNMTKDDRLRVLFHDFFPLCPSYTLIGADEKYCGVPSPAICGNCYIEVREKTGNLSQSIAEWRARWGNWLARADNIEVFSNSSKEIVLRVWPELVEKIAVKPHQMDNLPRKVTKSNTDMPVVGVLGSIGYQKGAKVLNQIADAAGGKLKIIVIGEIDPNYLHPKIHVHGRFSRNEISGLAEHYSIDRWFLPSIWPETFSFTTRECLATGLPVYAFDLGAQAEALRKHSQGTLLAINSETEFVIHGLCKN